MNKYRSHLAGLALSVFLGGCATQGLINPKNASCAIPPEDSALWRASPRLSLQMEYTDPCGRSHSRPMTPQEINAAPEMRHATRRGQTSRLMELAEMDLLAAQQKAKLETELRWLAAAGKNKEIHRTRLAQLKQYEKRRPATQAKPRVKTQTRIVVKEVEVPSACPSVDQEAEQMCGNLMKINPL